MQTLLSVTLIELKKDLSPLAPPARRCLEVISPRGPRAHSHPQEEPMNSSTPSHTAPHDTPTNDTPLNDAPHDDIPPGLARLPPDLARDPWVRELYDQVERFSADPARRLEYESTQRAFRDLISSALFHRKEGLAEGRAEGLAEGHAEGHAEGLAEGRAQERAEMLSNTIPLLLSSGCAPAQIATQLNLTPEERARLLPE